MNLLSKVMLGAKEAACAAGWRKVQARFLPHYSYNFEPHQLIFLCHCLDAVRNVPGQIVELGCSAGKTTIFLNRYMKSVGIDKKYLCVDTFSGFSERDMAYEVEKRGKRRNEFGSSWADWSHRLFELTMQFNGLDRVKAVKADVNHYEFEDANRIAFCLVDVDLYLPVKAALNKVYERLSPGGIVVVDDCVSNHKYDGARQAYSEFVQENGLPETYGCSKFGVITTALSAPFEPATRNDVVRPN